MSDNAFGITPEAPPDQAPPQAPTQEPQQQEGTPPPAPEAAPAPEPPQQEAPPRDEVFDEESAAFEAGEGEDGVRLGNRVYKDWNAADHVFRQFAGRAKAEARRRKDLEKILEEERRARMEAEARIGHPQQGGTSGAPQDTADPAPQSPKRLRDTITEDEFNRIVAEDGISAAFQKMAEAVDEVVDQRTEERFQEIAPIVNRERGAEMAASLFGEAADLQTEDGNYVFPELDPDQPSSDAVVAIWQRRLQDETFRNIAFTPTAVELSVLEYRSGLNSTASAPPAPAARPDAAALQGMGRQGSPSPASPGPTRRMIVDPEETARRIIADRTHSVFGVTHEAPIRR
jgi:hypothetical protein